MMREKSSIFLMMLTVFLAFVATAPAAEPVRMKYALSIYSDEKGVGFNQPEGIACSGDKLIVADSANGRLVTYSLAAGEPKGGKEIKIPQLMYPARVAINSKGEIFALDGRQHKIARLSPEGAFVQYMDLVGLSAENSTVIPVSIAIDGSDRVYIMDILSGRVFVMNAEGKKEREIAFPQTYGFMTDLAVDSKGTLFLVDGVNAIVYSAEKDSTAFSPITKSLKDDLKFGSNIATDNKGTLFVTDQNSGGIAVLGRDGVFRNRLLSLGWKEGAVRYPAQVCIDSEGDLFVADRGNNRVEKFAPLR